MSVPGLVPDAYDFSPLAGSPMILHERAKFFPFVPKRWHFANPFNSVRIAPRRPKPCRSQSLNSIAPRIQTVLCDFDLRPFHTAIYQGYVSNNNRAPYDAGLLPSEGVGFHRRYRGFHLARAQ